jgi:hypothetical protein
VFARDERAANANRGQDSRLPQTETASKVPSQEARIGEGEMLGVFDGEDLEDVLPGEELPPAIALFGSEDEAKGYVLLAAWGHMEPAIRRCKVSGSLTLSPQEVSGGDVS